MPDNKASRSGEWLKQAEADLRKAKILLDNKEYDGSVFYSHQACEKAFKAMWIVIKSEIPPGHSLIFFAKGINYPNDKMSGVRDLNPEYLITRYPDMAQGVPAEIYDEQIASKHYDSAKGALEWVKTKLK
ncbi:HEPN domain-containing protein [Candidatus Woesearchaeota archaeon]|nr:HEPN domain-containing protein [Candidatus Woesearchaeota archaeon]